MVLSIYPRLYNKVNINPSMRLMKWYLGYDLHFVSVSKQVDSSVKVRVKHTDPMKRSRFLTESIWPWHKM